MDKQIRIIVSAVITFAIVMASSVLHSQGDGQLAVETRPKHHTASGYQNYPYVETAAPKGALFYLRRFWGSVFTPDVPDGHVLSELQSMQLLSKIEGNRVTWLGHASFLISVSEKTILTDPFLTGFASPVNWAGPRRFVDHGIPLGKLPPIDIVLVSHNHYDHLDDETVRNLAHKERIHVVVPLGLKPFFDERGYVRVTELDWWEHVTIGGIEITALPSVHDSARSIGDRNQTLWASWAIESSETKIIFIGDTGYSEAIYKKIGKRFSSFDFAILPIGGYEPRELMWMSHVTPEEAVLIGRDVRAKTLIASHWGTISSLSDEPAWEPPVRFLKAGLRDGFSDEAVWTMKIGGSRPLE